MALYRLINMFDTACFWESKNLAELIEQAKRDVKSFPISIIEQTTATLVATSDFAEFKRSGYNIRYIR